MSAQAIKYAIVLRQKEDGGGPVGADDRVVIEWQDNLNPDTDWTETTTGLEGWLKYQRLNEKNAHLPRFGQAATLRTKLFDSRDEAMVYAVGQRLTSLGTIWRAYVPQVAPWPFE